MQETWVRSLGREASLEKEMATRSSILAWEIPWTEEPGGPRSMGLQSQTGLSGSIAAVNSCTLKGESWLEMESGEMLVNKWFRRYRD